MLDVQPTIQSVAGFQVAGVHAGLKADDALDLAMIVSDRPCVAAAVFTTNKVKAPPVLVNQEHLAKNPEQIRAVTINSKCANSCTGQQGMKNAYRMAELTAEKIDCSSEEVLVMSTGVIGTQLPMDKIEQGTHFAYDALGDDWQSAATAIMTTDTHPKLASVEVGTSQGGYTIAGIAKGAGMIAPNMATMLAIVVTDAQMPQVFAQEAIRASADLSFNRIVIDGDNSTNDTLLLMANGASGVTTLTSADLAQFQEALNAVCVQLAQDVVRDGEGVTKFITLDIRGASDTASAWQIGNTIATSPLVKTAFYGCDANWGRIIAAAGRAGVPFDPDKTTLMLSVGEEFVPGITIFAKGLPTDYVEDDAMAVMAEPSIYVLLDCGIGEGKAVIWTCDLSHEYVSINGDYRT